MTERIPVYKDPNCPPNTAFIVDAFTNELDEAGRRIANTVAADMFMVRGPCIETKPSTWRQRARWRWLDVRRYFRRLWSAILNRDYDD